MKKAKSVRVWKRGIREILFAPIHESGSIHFYKANPSVESLAGEIAFWPSRSSFRIARVEIRELPKRKRRHD